MASKKDRQEAYPFDIWGLPTLFFLIGCFTEEPNGADDNACYKKDTQISQNGLEKYFGKRHFGNNISSCCENLRHNILLKYRMLRVSSTEERKDKTTRNNGCDLTRNVDTDGMHEKEVLVIFLKTHLMNDTRRHRECGDTCRTDHGVDLGLGAEIEELRKHNAAEGIENEAEKTESEDHQGFENEELFCLHLECNGNTEEDGNEVCKNLLRGFGKAIQNAAFTDQVTEHKEEDERCAERSDHCRDHGDDDREKDSRSLGNLARLIGHTDQTFLFAGKELDNGGLNDRHERHIRVRRNDDRTAVLRLERIGNEDCSRTVSRRDNADRRRIVDRETEYTVCKNECEEDTKLRRRTEKKQLRIGKQRTEVDHGTDTNEEEKWEKLVGDTRIEEGRQRTVFRNRIDHRDIDKDRTKAHRKQERRFHLFLNGKIDEDTANTPHQNLSESQLCKAAEQSAYTFA